MRENVAGLVQMHEVRVQSAVGLTDRLAHEVSNRPTELLEGPVQPLPTVVRAIVSQLVVAPVRPSEGTVNEHLSCRVRLQQGWSDVVTRQRTCGGQQEPLPGHGKGGVPKQTEHRAPIM